MATYFPCSLIAAILLSGFTAFGQRAAKDQASTIEWQAPVPSQKSPHRQSLYFTGAGNTAEGLPVLSLQIRGRHLASAALLDTRFEPLSPAEAKLIPASFQQKQIEVTVEQGLEQRQPVSILSLVPLRLNPATGQAEKLVSFRYTTTEAPASARKTTAAARIYAETSVLDCNSCTFYKIGVTETGIHKLDFNFLKDLGLNPAQLDPRQLRLYGNGGGMLPQANAAPRFDDLRENAILVQGEADGTFHNNDYVLFYAQGPHTWSLNSNNGQFSHHFNVYSDTAYYFLTVGPVAGLRVQQAAPAPAGPEVSVFDERIHHEQDLFNPLADVLSQPSGRTWFGEKFTSNFTASREFKIAMPGLVPSGRVIFKTHVFNSATSSATFEFLLNGIMLGKTVLPARNTADYAPAGTHQYANFSPDSVIIPFGNELSVKINYRNGNNVSGGGNLDFFTILAKRQLRLYGNSTNFRSVDSKANPSSTFVLADAPASALTWDVTDPTRPRQLATTHNGSLAFNALTQDTVREFIAFTGDAFPAPAKAGKVVRQNLHALNLDKSLDLLIVTHPKFLAQANLLAQFRQRNDGLNAAVVTTTQVYNEFSSGAQDVSAIRDVMKLVYDRNPNPKAKPMYLLLFGDASFDYKYRTPKNTNFVPVYEAPQSFESLSPVLTYSSEDYYGFMDDTEGEWASSTNSHLLDVGVGRLPVQTPEEAQAVVSKLISYVNNHQNTGKWRNTVTLVADDGDFDQYFKDAQSFARKIDTRYPQYNVRKLYLDAYKQISVSSGKRSPEASDQIVKTVEQGTLIVNYIGHGGETGWAHERILEVPQINAWQNNDKLAFFVTATCEFGRYDDPARTSGAEYALLNPNGGAIGLLSTTRPVTSTDNFLINAAFYDSAIFVPVNGRMPRLGDVMRRTKNNSLSGDGNRNFTLLGDPSLRLAYPEKKAEVIRINGINTGTLPDTLKALSKMTIEGVVTDGGNVLTDFNGNLQATVYEKKTTITKLGDEGGSKRDTFSIRQNVIFDGLVSVVNGQWKVQFIVPKDISYQYGSGKISLYAATADGTRDAGGYSSRIIVGGSDPNAPADNTPPVVQLYLNDESFLPGGSTHPNPKLIALLSDESGINTAGIGIGHEITGKLDAEVMKAEPIILNDYYSAEKGSYQKGRVLYSGVELKQLKPGPHSIRVKAWDTYNNSSEEVLEFVVVNDQKLALEHVLNYPNPFSHQTSFHFDHNRAGDPLEVQVQIFTVSGKLVKTLSDRFESPAPSHVGRTGFFDGSSLSWDGKDEYQDKLAKGVYVYKVTVKSLRDQATANQYQKLVILN